LNAYGLGLEDVRNMLSHQNANRPKGQISDDTTTSDLAANDQLYSKPMTTSRWSSGTTMVLLSDCQTSQTSGIRWKIYGRRE
jgi:multidrug efflux pump subunit AcrB